MDDRWDFEFKNLRNWIIHLLFYCFVILLFLII